VRRRDAQGAGGEVVNTKQLALAKQSIDIALATGFVLGTGFGICIAIMFWVKP
jgi:hypothetical protein